MILYHGTNSDFSEIDLKKTKPYKDFGRGFYVTDIQRQAYELAKNRSRIWHIPREFKTKDTVLNSKFDSRIINYK